MRHLVSRSVALALVTLAVACGGNNREAARSTGPSSLGRAETTSATVPTRGEESDDVLLGIVTAADGTVLDQANLALERSRDDAIRAYAKRIVDDHEKIQRRVETLMAETPIVPATSEDGNRIFTTGANTVARLASTAPPSFDRSYAAEQVREQETLLAKLDALVGRASDKKLKHLLEAQRDLVADHRDEAKSLSK